MKFHFGNLYDSSSTVIEAKNLEHAIKIFKVEELFPEQFVEKTFVKDYDYDSNLSRNVYKFKKGPLIYVRATDKDGHVKEKAKILRKIPLEECIHVDFNSFIPKRTLLEGPKIKEGEDSTETLPVVGSKTEIQQCNKQELRARHDLIKKKMSELEEARHALNESMALIKSELEAKGKMIYIIETYMGIHEEVIQLQEGQKAPEKEPLTLYQQVLYMDEEIGVWENDGIDFKDIEKFDKWVCNHIDKFLYKPKSVCVFQVRRNPKDYGHHLVNIFLNQENFRTYFLIRNGENIYRIWSDVHISSRLFPAKDEYTRILKNKDAWGKPEENLQKTHESYLYGLIAIQGLIERTDIFGVSLRNQVTLLKPGGFTPKQVKLVRDGEQKNWVSSRESWKEFIKKNRKTIGLGTRIVVTAGRFRFHSSDGYDDCWRTAPFRVWSSPSHYEVYTVEEYGDRVKSYYHGSTIKIFFHPGDEIYTPGEWEPHQRRRRVPFRLYTEEVINFDAITIEDCDYYEKNRFERKDYLEILPILHWVKTEKLKEQKLEREFCRFLANQLGWSEKQYGKIQKTVDWWKLKNKWKRGLMKDDAKAVRMILRRLKKV